MEVLTFIIALLNISLCNFEREMFSVYIKVFEANLNALSISNASPVLALLANL